ncbi:hypothetical protein T36_2292 (plasmid) [Helicobacter cinaedi]|uniref:hypothetical protein n=1 Tax=Helicobacter cinaedi TaxID=213 RepID=UPI001F3F602F|nr:hypothetical protein [Helicobacter cinaedi]BDB65813.1 hypothetical protein T36_2292 [Helicobacter cinaedi]
MSHISSINFKKSNPIQTQHNDRNLPPNYLIGRAFESNRNHTEALALKNQIIKQAIQNYTDKTKQKFQAKSYEWSAVCNIKPDTTMQDLERLAKHFETKYGFQCYQIAIHRDEGHIDDNGLEQINHHAHLEFVTLDKDTGRNRQRELTPAKLRKMQDEVAQILQMQRGQDKRESKRKRIEPRVWAVMKEKEREAIKETHKQISENLGQALTRYDRALEISTAQKNSFSEVVEIHTNEILSLKEQKKRLEQERKNYIAEGGHTQEDYKALKALAEKGKTAERLEAEIAKLKEAHEKNKQKMLSTFFEREGIEGEGAKIIWGARYDKGEFEAFLPDNQALRQESITLRESLKNASKIVENQKNDIEQLKREKMDLKANFEALKQENNIFKEFCENLKHQVHMQELVKKLPTLIPAKLMSFFNIEPEQKAPQTALERMQEKSIQAIEKMKNEPRKRDLGRGR